MFWLPFLTSLLGLLAGYFLYSLLRKNHPRATKSNGSKDAGAAGQGEAQQARSAVENAHKQLMQEYTLREKTMASNLLAMEQINAFLKNLLQHLKHVNLGTHSASTRKEIQELIETVEDQLKDKNWSHFERFFAIANNNFLESLQQSHPGLTPSDRRLCMLVFMGLSSKEIADISMQRCETVEMARHRLRTKLQLGRSVNLGAYLAGLSC